MPVADVDIGPLQRILSASVGALTTSLLVTPLDVTKIRMQVQESSICEICEPDSAGKKTLNNNVKIKLKVTKETIPLLNTIKATSKRTPIQISRLNENYYLFSNGLMDHVIPTSRLRVEVIQSQCKHLPFKNSWDAFVKIARYEGINHLYTGLGITLWMAAPATVLYYSTYDLFRNYLLNLTENQSKHKNEYGNNNTLNKWKTDYLPTFIPLLSGVSGRFFAASVISPLELMRTQMMARTIHKDLSLLQALRLNLNDGGFLSLWKGLVPTLWRDVPFSGCYWMCYEYFKDYFVQKQNPTMQNGDKYTNDSVGSKSLFIASFLSGAVSGCIATILTQPFDVIKTRRQATLLGIPTKQEDANKKRILSLGRSIYRNEGITGLYVGIPARITRVPISCAIMVSTYEVGKILLKSTVVD